MPYIIDVGTAVPEYRVKQEQVSQFAARIFRKAPFQIKRLLPIFKNTKIAERHFCFGEEWFEKEQTFADKNLVYRLQGVKLGEAAVRDTLNRTGTQPNQIGHVFFVSSTGISTPSIDAYSI